VGSRFHFYDKPTTRSFILSCCDQGRYFIHRAYSPACKTGNVDTLFHFSENPTIEVYRANFERGWAFGFGVG